MRIAFVSLGCSKNLVDTQRILGMLLPHCQLTENYNKAEAIFVNTCGFIEAAKKEAIATILEMAEYKEQGSCRMLIVLGCLAERYQTELMKEMPEIDLIVPLHDYDKLRDILKENLGIAVDCRFGENRQLTGSPWSAYLKIADGCDNCCSYCSIPLIRKNYRSVPLDDLLQEAEELVAKGVKELVLIAQDTTLYGQDLPSKPTLIELLKALQEIPALHWIRVLYMYPALVNRALIDAMHSLSKVLMYFDIPLQHGSDRLLLAMNRRGTTADIIKQIEYLQGLNTPYVLRTTMMVGFPGETPEDFDLLLELVKKVRFHKLGAFQYSKEEDTPAYNFIAEVTRKIAKQRLRELLSLQQSISQTRNAELCGQTLEVLVEDKTVKGYQGRSLYNSPEGVDGYVYIQGASSLKLGEFYQVKIVAATIYDLFGEITS